MTVTDDELKARIYTDRPGSRTNRAVYQARWRARQELARRGTPMPAPRPVRDNREPVITAVTVQYRERPPKAGGKAPRRHRGLVPVEPRNGLPEFIPYTYRGTGHDMAGDCLCGTDCPWAAPPGQRPRKASITRAERERLQREELYDDSPRRQAERRARLADAS